jgi:hypothetical protein
MKTQLQLFAEPENLLAIAPARLRRILNAFDWDPGIDLDATPDVAALLAAFMNRNAPMPLMEALSYIADLSHWEVMDELLAGSSTQRAWFHEQLTPADVVTEVWLENPRIVQRVHAHRLVKNQRSFEFFQTHLEKPPKPPKPTDADLVELAAKLDQTFEARGRGRDSRVTDFERDGHLWFLIMHGESSRHACSFNDGRLGHINYNPARFDLVIFDPQLCELRINARLQWQIELYRTAFGDLLFDDKEFFPGAHKYVLDPLEVDAQAVLNCVDIEGLVSIKLRKIWWRDLSVANDEKTHSSPDILRGGPLRLPPRCRLIRAIFEAKIRGLSTARSLDIHPSNVARYKPDDAGRILERWMEARGLMQQRRGANHEDSPTILAFA